ncbi:MAG: phosphoenolpyruvate--protein phosphotransferase, partial [Lachnospiraceae bacterium]|nr:phosphoenolpyruvate--protein phosphotransferase [Lachnospiraceae bacterium]
MEKVYVGKTASRGIAVAKIYKYEELDLSPVQCKIQEQDKEGQTGQFLDARESVRAELEKLAVTNEIFSAHLEMVMDFTLEDSVKSKINNDAKNAESAVSEAIAEVAAVFEMMDDEYMKERAADIQDVGKRLMAQLKGVQLPDIGSLHEEAIILAKDLFPSDTVKINTDYVK